MLHCNVCFSVLFFYKRTSLKKQNGNKQLFTLMERRHFGVCIALWERLTGMGGAYSVCQLFHLDMQTSLLGSGNAEINNLGFLPRRMRPKGNETPCHPIRSMGSITTCDTFIQSWPISYGFFKAESISNPALKLLYHLQLPWTPRTLVITAV